jgi:hypothetical protein
VSEIYYLYHVVPVLFGHFGWINIFYLLKILTIQIRCNVSQQLLKPRSLRLALGGKSQNNVNIVFCKW